MAELPERDTTIPAERQGLFRKFDVRRTDGSDAPGGKHHGCRYFVLDMNHDPYARVALSAYADVCALTHPELARDIREKWGIRAAPQPAQVAVKPLEWKLAWLGEDGVYARTPFGQTYFAYSDGRWEDTNTISHQAAPATMDAAKAAAQADFASCIAPVLTPSPADSAVEALRGAFITCLSDGQSGRYEVTAKFKTLRDAQEAHSAIIHALKGDTP